MTSLPRGLLLVLVGTICGLRAEAQSSASTPALPNPYLPAEPWGQLPAGRSWGSTNAVAMDTDGTSIWVAERCGANSCAGKTTPPILEFDSSGKLVRSFGAGIFVFPHGIFAAKDGGIWVVDDQGADGKGQQVIKFDRDGRVLMRLGVAGVAGNDASHFNRPSAVVVAPSGEIFVADGHGDSTGARIVKFSADGTFISAWGRKGSAPGDLTTPHSLAFDSRGRLFVADRANNRIQIFDQDGRLLAVWTQFGRPSSIYIDPKDNIYVADSESNSARHPGWGRGIRIGRVSDGVVTAFIPDPYPPPDPGRSDTSGAEGVAADSHGTIYGADVDPGGLVRYVRK
jgi:hypothetical protein